MFNEDIKRRFLTGMPEGSVKWKTGIFERTAKSEEYAGKDLAQMSKLEAKYTVNAMGISDYSMVYNLRSLANEYVKWCIDNAVFDNIEAGILELDIADIDISDVVLKSFFKDEEDLVNSMRKVRMFNDGYAEPVVLILAWYGLPKQQVYELQDNQVDLENRIIYNLDGSIALNGFSDFAYHILKEYVECKESTRGNEAQIYRVIKDRSTTDFLKRFCSPESSKLGKRYTRALLDDGIYRMNEAYASKGFYPRFTFENVRKSGRLYAISELEKQGIDVTARKNKGKVEQVLCGAINYRNAMWLYGFYKKVFNQIV